MVLFPIVDRSVLHIVFFPVLFIALLEINYGLAALLRPYVEHSFLLTFHGDWVVWIGRLDGLELQGRLFTLSHRLYCDQRLLDGFEVGAACSSG